MEDSVFTKIIKGELPAHKVYEDEKTIAFLTIEPLVEGHTLVVPKVQIDNFEDLPDDYYKATFETVKLVSKQVKKVYGVKKAIVTIMGYEVPHAHIHIMPAKSEEEYFEAIESRGTEHKLPSSTELEEIAKKLKIN